MIGGSSAINAMIYMRGQAADYDGWRQLGLAGWGWDDVLPYLPASTRTTSRRRTRSTAAAASGGSSIRASAGTSSTRSARPPPRPGIPKIDDFNTGDNEGSSYFQVNQKRGRRWSAARGFLKPVLKRPNLRLETGVHVERVVLEGARAVGVAFTQRRASPAARGPRARSSSRPAPSPRRKSSNCPGIGDGERLAAARHPGRPPRPGRRREPAGPPAAPADLQGRGRAHAQHRLRQALEARRDGARIRLPAHAARSPWRRRSSASSPSSSPDYATANLEFHFQPLSLDKWGEGLHPFGAFTASVCNLRPSSRGSVHARRAPDPATPPAIRPNYLSTDEDRRVAVDALRLARRIVGQAPLARYRPEEYKPGAHLTSDDELVAGGGRPRHDDLPPGRHGQDGVATDPLAVLDERLRVRGVERLRVVDASAMPRITSGNTNSPTVMIAEKGAAMVLAGSRAAAERDVDGRLRGPRRDRRDACAVDPIP